MIADAAKNNPEALKHHELPKTFGFVHLYHTESSFTYFRNGFNNI